MTSVTRDGQVEFRFFRRGVKEVNVMGDFNEWSGDALAMRSSGDGWWSAEAKLVSGEYRFRYVADGVWFTDYASNGIELVTGGFNSVLIVPGGKEGNKSAKLVA